MVSQDFINIFLLNLHSQFWERIALQACNDLNMSLLGAWWFRRNVLISCRALLIRFVTLSKPIQSFALSPRINYPFLRSACLAISSIFIVSRAHSKFAIFAYGFQNMLPFYFLFLVFAKCWFFNHFQKCVDSFFHHWQCSSRWRLRGSLFYFLFLQIKPYFDWEQDYTSWTQIILRSLMSSWESLQWTRVSSSDHLRFISQLLVFGSVLSPPLPFFGQSFISSFIYPKDILAPPPPQPEPKIGHKPLSSRFMKSCPPNLFPIVLFFHLHVQNVAKLKISETIKPTLSSIWLPHRRHCNFTVKFSNFWQNHTPLATKCVASTIFYLWKLPNQRFCSSG